MILALRCLPDSGQILVHLALRYTDSSRWRFASGGLWTGLTIKQVKRKMLTPDAGWRGWRFVAPTGLGVLAAFLLLWGLADKYLWQDEAQTAVLATRMLRFGRPLAYDGLNLVTVDIFAAEDIRTISQRTTSPRAAIDYYVGRGDFKSDTVWKFHPWGQFIVAAASFKMLGQTTIAARLPFALAGILTVLLLYRWVEARFGSPLMAQLAAVFLVFNAYWILHMRQCRYYSLSSLFLVLTLMSYSLWQRRGLWGAVAFITAAWCWFEVDYGTVWPVLGVLFVDALLADRRNLWRPVLVGAALAASIAPFIYYYGLWGRLAAQEGAWPTRFRHTVFNLNEYVVPLPMALAAVALVAWRWKALPAAERRLLAIACGIMFALAIWVPSVAPGAYLRYVIIATPVACLLSAWVLVRGFNLRTTYAWLGAAVLVLTPWLSMPLHVLHRPSSLYPNSPVFRAELSTLRREIFAYRPDPNRLVIGWLRQNAAPSDEILINYEDLPLMFYLPNPIRGGLGAFRVEDDAKNPPSFLVIRHSTPFVHWPVFQREIDRYQWIAAPVNAPDIMWGNNPDPMAEAQDFNTERKIIVARRATGAEGAGIP